MDIDTVVVSAQPWGMENVFLKENRWYAIQFRKEMIPKLKYIAIYEKKPIKAIRFMGKIKKIIPYGDTGKYEVILDGKPFEISPIKRSKEHPKLAPQRHIYSNKKLIDKGKFLEDIFYKN